MTFIKQYLNDHEYSIKTVIKKTVAYDILFDLILSMALELPSTDLRRYFRVNQSKIV